MSDQHANKPRVAKSIVSSTAGFPLRSKRPESRLLLAAERYGLVGLLVVTILVFSLIPGSGPTFASQANLNNILGGEVTLCVVAIAFTLPLMVGQLDSALQQSLASRR